MKYEIRLDGLLPKEREIWFEGWHITHSPENNTLLIGFVQDQIELHGVLNKIRNLNLSIQSIKRISENGRFKYNEHQESVKNSK